jgi:hypothetical protein
MSLRGVEIPLEPLHVRQVATGLYYAPRAVRCPVLLDTTLK